MIDRVDHLVYAAPDLDAACALLEQRLGVRASPGGQHLGRGTRNALIAIGAASYFEIIAPDPAQPAPKEPRWLGIDALNEPRLVAWAAHGRDLTQFVADVARLGAHLGAVSDGRRERSDGVVLTWQVTNPNASLGDVVIPFFIDWGASPHPSATAIGGPRLVSLSGEHPEPTRVRGVLGALDIDLPIAVGSRPALVATLDTARGPVEIR
jgi:hypothetical protein